MELREGEILQECNELAASINDPYTLSEGALKRLRTLLQSPVASYLHTVVNAWGREHDRGGSGLTLDA